MEYPAHLCTIFLPFPTAKVQLFAHLPIKVCKKLHLQRKILSFSAQNSHSVHFFADKIKPFSPPITPTHYKYIIQPLNFCCPKPQLLSSCSVRRPIGFRPPSNRIPSAVQSDSVRRPTHIPNIFITHSQYIHHNLPTLTKHIHSIYTHIFGV